MLLLNNAFSLMVKLFQPNLEFFEHYLHVEMQYETLTSFFMTMTSLGYI